MNLNQLIRDVHQNAIEHGWWDKPRSVGNTRAMIHDEVSEALQEYRTGMPMLYHVCPKNHKICEFQEFSDNHKCNPCNLKELKPEGIAVELADMVIRIFDYLGKFEVDLLEDDVDMAALIKTAIEEKEQFATEECPDIIVAEVPDLCDKLHSLIVLDKYDEGFEYLLAAIGLAGAWVNHRGLDFEQIILEKHAYNKTRSYRHGNKLC